MSVRIPKYRKHSSGLAFVEIHGQRQYLGQHGTPESKEKYRRIVAEFCLANHERPVPSGENPTINELMVPYLEYADGYYVKNGKPTTEARNVRQALRPLHRLYGHTKAGDFGPKTLKLVREQMILAGLSRKYINDNVNRIRAMFKWAVSEELIPETVYRALMTVAGLRAGRSAAKESRPIEPVPEADVTATLPELTPQVATMVQLQLCCGARPGEVTSMRPCDINTDGNVWIYKPDSHKTEHHGRKRLIYLGPKAQELLRPYLDRVPQAFCFSPAEATKAHRAKLRRNRQSPLTPSQRARKPKTDAKRTAGNRYTKDSYRKAIERAAKRAGVARWSPNQLRHAKATEIRAKYGIEAAQVVLGHSDAVVTGVYAERDAALAVSVMQAIG